MTPGMEELWIKSFRRIIVLAIPLVVYSLIKRVKKEYSANAAEVDSTAGHKDNKLDSDGPHNPDPDSDSDVSLANYHAKDDQSNSSTAIEKNGSAEPSEDAISHVFCRKCGKELKLDSEFCSFCGTKVIHRDD